jgi:S1-C subfamily serine protease
MAELPNLANLMIRDTGVTRDGLRKLREQKPDMQVQARGEAMLGVNADIGTSPLVLTSIFHDSGASQAGMREGDTVLSVDGNPVKDFADLTIAIYGCKTGEKVRVEYERNGAKKTAVVTLKKRPDDQQ